MTAIRRHLALAVLLGLILSACQSTPPPRVIQPYGSWSGNASIDGRYAGGIAVNYDTKYFVWCVTSTDCMAGGTDGWDLVDSGGNRMTGQYEGDYVFVTYRHGSSILTANLFPFE